MTIAAFVIAICSFLLAFLALAAAGAANQKAERKR